MDFTAKRKAKRLAKTYFTAAYVMLFVFVISLVSAILIGVKSQASSSWGLLAAFSPMVFCLTLGAMGQHHLDKRYRYMATIKLYRENRMFAKVLDSLRANNYNAAVDAYKMIKQGDKKKFLYGFFIGMSLNSTDPEQLEKGKDKFDIVRGYYDPANVRFN